MKILVTGGAGYVGCVLIPLLLERKHEVRCIDLGIFGFDGLNPVKDKIELLCEDIRQADRNMVVGCDVIINLAAFSNDPLSDQYERANKDINTGGVSKLADVAAHYGIPKFIQASSASIYDGLEDTDILTEDVKVQPRRGYALSKYKAEQALFSSKVKNPYALRKGTLYGISPRMRFDLIIQTMFKTAFETEEIQCHCGGSQWRPLLSVNDASRAYTMLAETDEECGIYNLVDKNLQVLDVARIIQKSYPGGRIEIRIDDGSVIDRSYRTSGDKLTKTFKFKYEDSIEKTIDALWDKVTEFDLKNPLYYNIQWVNQVLAVQKIIGELQFKEIFY